MEVHFKSAESFKLVLQVHEQNKAIHILVSNSVVQDGVFSASWDVVTVNLGIVQV